MELKELLSSASFKEFVQTNSSMLSSSSSEKEETNALLQRLLLNYSLFFKRRFPMESFDDILLDLKEINEKIVLDVVKNF